MAFSVNFAPKMNLVRATLAGVQVGKEELLAYDYACEYYNSEEVALQTDKNPVEWVECDSYKQTAIRSYRQDKDCILSSAENFLSAATIRILLKDNYNPNSSRNIFIHWPEVTVSNEKDESINIQDLFCRVPLFYKGLSFRDSECISFMRTTYPKSQWDAGYIHSHTQSLDSHFLKFRHVCLGTGPIRNTVNTLQMNPTDESAAALFFWELDKVTQVESLRGVPYFRLSSINTRNEYVEVDSIPKDSWSVNRVLGKQSFYRDFIISFLNAVPLSFGFNDGKYILNCSFTEFAIKLSNYYKRWHESVTEAIALGLKYPVDYLSCGLPIIPYTIKDGKIFTQGGDRSYKELPDRDYVFKFKDKSFHLTIIQNNDDERNYLECTLVDLNFTASLIEFILTSVNTATSKPYEERKEKPAATGNLQEQYSYMLSRNTDIEGGETITNFTSTAN